MARRRKKKSKSRRGPKLGRVLAIGGLGLLVLLVLGGFAIYLGLRAYLHSDRFRGMLAERVSDTFDAEGEFADFKWTGSTAYTDTFKARGFEAAPFSRVKAESIKTRVNFGSVRRGVWELAAIDIARVNLLIDEDGRAPRPASFDDGASGGDDGGGGFLGRFIPQEVEVKHLGIGEFNCNVDAGGSEVLVRRIAVDVEPVSSSEMYRIRARRGTVRVGGQPPLELAEAELRVGGGRAIIDSATLTFLDGATVGLSGDAVLAGGGISDLDLEVRVRDLAATEVLPDDWVKRLKGTIEVDATVSGGLGAGGGGDDVLLEGEVRLLGGVLEAMPVLERVDEMLGSSRFRRLAFSDFRVRFERRADVLELRDYYVLSASSACIKGNARLPEGGAPTGSYMLGVTADTIKWLPLIKKAVIEGVFSHSRDEAFALVFGDSPGEIEKPPEGFRWAVARIVPGAPDPYTADLRGQFFDVGGMAIWGQLAGLSKKGVEALGLLADAATAKGVDVATVLAAGDAGGGMFSPENLLRAAGELGVTESMETLMKDIVDSVGELPKTLLDVGGGLLDGLLP